MDFLPDTTEKLLRTTLTLMQYPVLASRIRAHMREELFKRGIIDPKSFESRVRDNAIQSQKLEGITNPYGQETSDLWETRKSILRDHLTDLLFSRHLPFDLLEKMIKDTLAERAMQAKSKERQRQRCRRKTRECHRVSFPRQARLAHVAASALESNPSVQPMR